MGRPLEGRQRVPLRCFTGVEVRGSRSQHTIRDDGVQPRHPGAVKSQHQAAVLVLVLGRHGGQSASGCGPRLARGEQSRAETARRRSSNEGRQVEDGEASSGGKKVGKKGDRKTRVWPSRRWGRRGSGSSEMGGTRPPCSDSVRGQQRRVFGRGCRGEVGMAFLRPSGCAGRECLGE